MTARMFYSMLAAGLAILGIILMWNRTLQSKVRQKTEELSNTTARLRASHDASRGGFALVDLEGIVVEANARLSKMIDRQVKPGDSIQRIQADLGQSDSQKAEESDWESLNSDIENERIFEWHGKDADGNEQVIEIHCASVIDDHGTQIARRWSFHDLTEKRTLEKKLIQSQKMEAVGRLAGGIAHDFNNLLTGITGNLAVARLRGDEPLNASSDCLDAAESAAHRAAELIKQMLGYSRKSNLTLKAGNVNDVIEKLLLLLRHSLDSTIEIKTDLEPKIWMSQLDHIHIEQVLMNLCVNARDAFGNRGGRILVETENVQRDGKDYICVSVSDNGSGMTEETKNRIFEPFFTTKDQGKGTGLGLAMSFGIIEQHNGTMECDSQLGSGTKFSIFLPKVASELGNSSQEQNPSPSQGIHGGGKHVLIVDDEAVVRAVGQGILKHHGFAVTCACHGAEALEMLATGIDVDIVILDLTMPQMSGKETFQKLRQLYPKLPVVICSGYLVDPEAFAKETGSTPDAFVPKPFELEKLLETVGENIKSEPLGVA